MPADRTLVAVNGLGGLSLLWDGFAAALPAGTQLRVLDLPGHGDLPPSPDYRYPALVEDIARRTRDLDPFPLLGWSVGAAVAWLFAARHPERVTRLVLLDPGAPHQSRFRHGPVPEPAHPFTYASAGEAVEALRGLDPTLTEQEGRSLYQRNAAGRWEPRFDPAYLPVLVEEARDHGEEYFVELAKIQAPTLVLFGERGLMQPRDQEEIASALRSARVETVAGAGHFMVHERASEVARLVIAFLDEDLPA